ncbi:DUF1858 domain-containing protein [Helcococcus kunzii]|uniref:Hydrid cluster protein-associated redox disulfide domain n=1 Tax=Helcococcus kunzii ATCC 51366 TaxID=883114 RepID=H3NLA1_9FIRM|nr:DUF1858 domain-containing protein [Helcococcus kunzii]EHR36082.1 hydrid cluster protein-associated redox disulfide domain [Helcococcus kunzii ATCC 51366]MCT1796656.1 DUF1858 domain-containing protein [Helcococcus kunzii]MCT1988700.1 DUF1858 domain-containing protein [Helcococcus kunzii]QUY64116.1 DUF1858 domain-containing protein [Helcococcus kunzii]QZO76570.1 DUF1858 domain-containing protein [Helcococcus kunzii]
MTDKKDKVIITSDMILADVIQLKPQTLGTLLSFGLACIGCPVSQLETVEEAAMVHGIEIDFLLEQLNK